MKTQANPQTLLVPLTLENFELSTRLAADIDELFEGQLIVKDALLITTANPRLLEMLQIAFEAHGATLLALPTPVIETPLSIPSSPPDPEPELPGAVQTCKQCGGPIVGRRKQARFCSIDCRKKHDKLHPKEPHSAETEDEVTQTYKWRILSTGKDLSDLSNLLSSRRLAPGDQVRHKTRGIYTVVENKRGQLTLQRVPQQ